MKQLILNITMAAGLLFAMAACQREDTAPAGEPAPVSFAVTVAGDMEQAGERSRVTNEDLNGHAVNRCVMEVYHGGERVFRRDVAVEGGSVVIDDFNLVTGQAYDFVFWADCAGDASLADGAYNTAGGLTAIAVTDHVAAAATDAFCAVMRGVDVSGGFSAGVTLTRPFALLSLKADNLGGLAPGDSYVMTCNDMPKRFNALTGQVAVRETYSATVTAAADGELSSVFVWVAGEEAEAMDVAVDDKQAPGIPLRRNYRTNVTVAL